MYLKKLEIKQLELIRLNAEKDKFFGRIKELHGDERAVAEKKLEQLKKDYKKTLDTDIDTIEDEEKRTELIAEKKYIESVQVDDSCFDAII